MSVRFVDLEPKWIHPNLFVFRCPCCRKLWLSCKTVRMDMGQQCDLFRAEFGDDWANKVLPDDVECAWNVAAGFDSMTVTPSIDASRAGHWHGFITNGEIR